MQKFDFDYDAETDDLFLFNPKSKSKGSVEVGDIILDYNAHKELVGIQIRNASEWIKDICNEGVSKIKEILNGMTDCKINIKTKNNFLLIKVYLISKLKELSPVISLPRIIDSSPALGYA